MKKFNLFAIGVVAMLMAAVNVSAADGPVKGEKLADGKAKTYETLKACVEEEGETKCTLTRAETLADDITISQNMTIVTKGYALTVPSSKKLIISDNAQVTIDGGNLVLNGATVDVKYKALLKVTNADKDPDEKRVSAVKFTGTASTVNVTTGTFEVSGNKSTSAIISNATESKISVTSGGKLLVNDNAGNGSNGAEYLTVEVVNATVEANNNGAGGISAIWTLSNGATVSATGNGYNGIEMAGGSKINAGSSMNVKGNLVKTDDLAKQKADVIFKGAITVEGNLTAGSLAREKSTASNGTGKIEEGTFTVKGNGVAIEENKAVCDGKEVTDCGTLAKAVEFTNNGAAAVKVAKTVTVYGTNDEELTFDNTVDEIVIDKNAAVSKISVAAGTKVSNLSSKAVYAHVTGETSLVEIPAATTDAAGKDVAGTATVGTKPAEEQKPGEEQNPGEEQKPGTTTPDDDAENPDTLDNVTSVAAMGGISLAIAAAGIVTLKKREN